MTSKEQNVLASRREIVKRILSEYSRHNKRMASLYCEFDKIEMARKLIEGKNKQPRR